MELSSQFIHAFCDRARSGFLQFRIALVKKKPFPSYLLLILDGMCAVFFVLANVFNEI